MTIATEERSTMTQFIPGAEHVEVPYEDPGLCPECLNLETTGRGGEQVQLLERDGKWICPRSGPSLVQQYAKEGVSPAAAFGVVNWDRLDGVSDLCLWCRERMVIWNWLRRKKDKTAPS